MAKSPPLSEADEASAAVVSEAVEAPAAAVVSEADGAPATVEGSAHSAHAAEHGMHLDDRTRRDVVKRLRSANGHLEGVLRMLDDPSVYCVDVLKQVKAVQGALSKVNESVLRSHIRDHVVTAAQRGDSDVIVDELMEALKYRA